ncbi:MAG TPA: hypothetical protein VFH07_12750 [Chitinophagaceae bacterium]|nr:hypothetical protein [Chitinophagaceae bacterium]
MNRLILITGIFIFFGITGFSQQKKLKDLIGRWEIVGEQNMQASLDVIDSSTIVLVYMGETKKIVDYKFNFEKSPIWFDFSTADSASMISVKSLLEIVNDNMIKWQLFVDESRPDYFSSTKGDLFYLRKVKLNTNAGVAANGNSF